MAEIDKETVGEAPAASDASVKAPETPKADKPKKTKPKKPNIFVRIGARMKKFWKEYVSELKKVSWMSWKDVKKNTVLVVCAVIAFSVAIAVVDTVFGQIIEGVAGMVG